MTTTTLIIAGFAGGWIAWTLAEYLLHRFAMHALSGRGIMSREHLEHHVGSTWSFSSTHLLSWAGMLLVGCAGLMPLVRLAGVTWSVAVSVSVGWAVGYFFYEFVHMRAHLAAPTGAYSRWVRRHHFHHHFGRPKFNHGVSVGVWDHAFGTYERPERVRVPRRMALPWLVDEYGELRPEFADDYVLVGDCDAGAREAMLDRARAFASAAPVD
ncbi:MAG: sterol desaturase family protein [Microthrixaceae bacterium]